MGLVLSGPKEEGGTLVTFLKPDVEQHDDPSRVVAERLGVPFLLGLIGAV